MRPVNAIALLFAKNIGDCCPSETLGRREVPTLLCGSRRLASLYVFCTCTAATIHERNARIASVSAFDFSDVSQ